MSDILRTNEHQVWFVGEHLVAVPLVQGCSGARLYWVTALAVPPLGMPHPASEGRFDYLLVESIGISEPLPVAAPRLGRRTVLTFPLFPPPQKN